MISGFSKIVFNIEDVSQGTPAIGTSVGAVVINSNQGDITKPKLCSVNQDFINEYGKPIPDGNHYGMYSALSYLKLGSQLMVLRAVHADALYGGVEIKQTGHGPNIPIPAGVASPAAYTFGTNGIIAILAKDPGAWNNSIAISLSIDTSGTTFTINVYWINPTTGAYTLEESWDVSRQQQIDGYGNQMYLVNKINGNSNYIYVIDNTAVGNTVMPAAQTISLVSPYTGNLIMACGANGSPVTDADMSNAWQQFLNKQLAVNILIEGGWSYISGTVVVPKAIQAIAAARVDCTYICDVPLTSCGSTSAGLAYRASFPGDFKGTLERPWMLVFDTYNGQQVIIPRSGAVAGIYALTDYAYGGAFGAPAGMKRGVIAEALQLVYGPPGTTKTFDGDAELDLYDENQINSAVDIPGTGIVEMAENTLQSTESALSEVHVVRLINQIAVAITNTAKPYLYEPLLARTFTKLASECNSFFQILAGLGAFDQSMDVGYQVLCNSTNNTPATIAAQTLILTLYIKPVMVAKYIQINAVITRSTASFEVLTAGGIV